MTLKTSQIETKLDMPSPSISSMQRCCKKRTRKIKIDQAQDLNLPSHHHKTIATPYHQTIMYAKLQRGVKKNDKRNKNRHRQELKSFNVRKIYLKFSIAMLILDAHTSNSDSSLVLIRVLDGAPATTDRSAGSSIRSLISNSRRSPTHLWSGSRGSSSLRWVRCSNSSSHSCNPYTCLVWQLKCPYITHGNNFQST